MNIGITIHLQEENESLWINGIKLNAAYLLKALKEIGYNAYLVNSSDIQSPYETKVNWNTTEIPIFDYSEVYKDTDIMIWLGATYGDQDILDFKSSGPNKKVIKYVCGNNYMLDMENSIFGEGTGGTGYNQLIDEVWYVPQQEELNREYYRVLHNLPASKVRPVPFIWDPMFLDQFSMVYNNSEVIEKQLPVPIYRPGKPNSEKRITSFEPNINVGKWHMINLLIAEDYLNSGGDFEKLTILCGNQLLTKPYYQSILRNTKLWTSDPVKLSYQPRLQVTHALAAFTDIIIAHQWAIPLNYSYLDALYLQFPLVHNAPMIKDAGYYYSGNNIAMGANQLKLAIEQHDSNIEEYTERSEKVLTRYTIFNEGLLETYKQLIETTMGIKDHNLSSIYDWSTNLYK
jgi:hypothetical protein